MVHSFTLPATTSDRFAEGLTCGIVEFDTDDDTILLFPRYLVSLNKSRASLLLVTNLKFES
jgi:hypothetical protein